MTIIVEPTENFKLIPKAWQDAAKRYMFGKDFNSLREIFNQQDEHGCYVLSNFHVAEERIRPSNLPKTMTEVDIIADWADTHGGDYSYRALRAKVKTDAYKESGFWFDRMDKEGSLSNENLRVLYTNDTKESREVEELLKENNIYYEPVERPVDHPELLSKEGDFVGSDSIRGYVNLLLSE